MFIKRPYKDLRIGIIGFGAVAINNHLPFLNSLGIVPSAIIDTNESAKDQITKLKMSKTIFSTNLDSVITEFDIAIVCVPHIYHLDICKILIANSKHFILEKPPARNHKETLELLNVLKDYNKKVTINHFRRFLHITKFIKDAINTRRFGKLLSFDWEEGHPWAWDVASDSFWDPIKSGGGVLIDTGSHVFDLLFWWLGMIQLIDYKDDSFGGVEANCIVSIKSIDDSTGSVRLSRSMELRNTAIFNFENLHIEFGLDKNYCRVINISNGFEIDLKILNQFQSYKSLFTDLYKDIFNSILCDHDVYIDLNETADYMKLITACYVQKRQLSLPWLISK